jgi:hypothetical protein
MSKFKESIEKFAEKIESAIVDFTTLDVVTVTGDLSFIFNEKDGGKNKSVKDIILELKKESTVGKAEIVAFTHMDFDQDTIQYVGEKYNIENPLLKAHAESVITATKARNAMLSFIANIVD